MSRHEGPDEPQIPPSLLAKLQAQQGQTPVYRVGQDGTGQLETPSEATTPSADAGGDLHPMLRGIESMAIELRQTVEAVPDAMTDGVVLPEKFDLSTRLAIIHAGNAIDYAVRRVADIGRERRIFKLRSELASEMKAAGLQGDPATGLD